MPGFQIDTKFESKGPLFKNPTARIAIFILDSKKHLADTGKTMVIQRLHKVLKNPTGRYESKIQVERATNDYAVTDGRRVLYGPWLEGTGSMNAPVTRFKGYKTFRLTKQELDRAQQEILRPIIRKFISDMNG